MTSARGSGVWQSGDGAMVRLDGIFIRQHVASSPRQQPSPAHRRNRAVRPSSPRRPPPALRGSRTKPGGRRLPAVQLCAAASTLRDPAGPMAIPNVRESSSRQSALEKRYTAILAHSAAPIPERWRPPAIRRPQSFAASKVLPAALAALESQCG